MSAAPLPRLESRCETLVVRGHRCNVRRWGDPSAPPLIMLHGTRDSSITFQFVVDALRNDYSIVAPDWRGHGHSAWVPQSYWFHEFLGDLDVIADTYCPGCAIPVIGHSLGANIASIYAGIRPERVSQLISLDGFGPLASRVPVDVPKMLKTFLSIPTAARPHQAYAGIGEMAKRLQRANHRLSSAKSVFLAEHSSTEIAGGGRRWLYDPSHELSLPTLHTIEDWRAVWAGITAPVLWIISSDDRPGSPTGVPGEMDRRAAMLRNVVRATVAGTGHNLHHDEPDQVAQLIEAHLIGREYQVPEDQVPEELSVAGNAAIHRRSAQK